LFTSAIPKTHLIPNYTIELIPLKIKNNPIFTPSPLERVGVRITIKNYFIF
jgi:hypothetical protein